MSLTEIQSAIQSIPKDDQIQLAMYILENIKTTTSVDTPWYTNEVKQEMLMRKKEALADKSSLLSYEEVVGNFR